MVALATIAMVAVVTSCDDASGTSIDEAIESQGGSVDLDPDGGLSVQTDEGTMTIDENGDFVITDADGSVVTGSADSDSGDIDVQSDEGSFRVDTSGQIPEEWPGDVPQPEGIEAASATVVQSPTELAITVTGQATDSFADRYSAALESQGYERTSNFESDANITRVYENETWTISINTFPDGDTNQVAVSLFPTQP